MGTFFGAVLMLLIGCILGFAFAIAFVFFCLTTHCTVGNCKVKMLIILNPNEENEAEDEENEEEEQEQDGCDSICSTCQLDRCIKAPNEDDSGHDCDPDCKGVCSECEHWHDNKCCWAEYQQQKIDADTPTEPVSTCDGCQRKHEGCTKTQEVDSKTK